MKDVIEFLHMGGYAPYVWSAFGLAVLTLAANLLPVLGAERRSLRKLGRQLRRREAQG
jgi:heme exporter protein D